jgi:hypothetical protein
MITKVRIMAILILTALALLKMLDNIATPVSVKAKGTAPPR